MEGDGWAVGPEGERRAGSGNVRHVDGEDRAPSRLQHRLGASVKTLPYLEPPFSHLSWLDGVMG